MEKVLHRIKAHLYDNVLTTDNPNDFIARVASERSLNVREVCNTAVTRGGADISASAMEHAINLWPADSYKLEVTTQFTIGALLKKPRTAIFDKVLTVS